MSNIYGNYLNLHFDDNDVDDGDDSDNDDVCLNFINKLHIDNNNNDLLKDGSTQNNDLWLSNNFINHHSLSECNLNDIHGTVSWPCTVECCGGGEASEDNILGCFILSLPDIHLQGSNPEDHYHTFPSFGAINVKRYNKHLIKKSACKRSFNVLPSSSSLPSSSLSPSLSSLSVMTQDSSSSLSPLKLCVDKVPHSLSHHITDSSSSPFLSSLLSSPPASFSLFGFDEGKFSANQDNCTLNNQTTSNHLINVSKKNLNKDHGSKHNKYGYDDVNINDGDNHDDKIDFTVKNDIRSNDNDDQLDNLIIDGEDRSENNGNDDENKADDDGHKMVVDEIKLLNIMRNNMDDIQRKYQTLIDKLDLEKNKLLTKKDVLENVLNTNKSKGSQQNQHQFCHNQQHLQQQNQIQQYPTLLQHQKFQQEYKHLGSLINDDIKKSLNVIDDKLIEIDRIKRNEIERTSKKMNEEHDKMISSILIGKLQQQRQQQRRQRFPTDLESTSQTKSLPVSRSSSAKMKFFEQFDETFLKYKQGSIHVALHNLSNNYQGVDANDHQNAAHSSANADNERRNNLVEHDARSNQIIQSALTTNPIEVASATNNANICEESLCLLERIKRDAAHLIERPIRRREFNLKSFIEQSGHNLSLHTNIKVTRSFAVGPLYKISRKLKMAMKRWYVLDRNNETFTCYRDEYCKNIKDVISFQDIENVYIDESSTNCTKFLRWSFCIKTASNVHMLVASSSYLRQIWIDILTTVITGCQEY